MTERGKSVNLDPTRCMPELNIQDHLAGDAGLRHRRPGNDLAVAGIQHEEDAHDLAAASMDLEMVRAPSHIRAKRDDDAVMRPTGPVRRMGFQRQAVMLHDPQHPLGIDGRQAFGAPLSV